MRKISKIEPKLPVIQARKKVAAYARVSRGTERLMHSVSAQVSYYSTLIQKNPEWEYAGVYADMGISGTAGVVAPFVCQHVLDFLQRFCHNLHFLSKKFREPHRFSWPVTRQ